MKKSEFAIADKSLRRPALTIDQILGWADVHYRATGRWPTQESGEVQGTVDLTWRAVHAALRQGLRGLPGGDSLARLLARNRGKRNVHNMPTLTVEQVLVWADSHHLSTGHWPNRNSGQIASAPDEKWGNVDMCLRLGFRGLPCGSSLARLLAQMRGARNIKALPPLTEEQILAWADAHRRRTGHWPIKNSGPVVDAPSETWKGLDTALRKGDRGLRGGTSLSRLLSARRGVHGHKNSPPYTIGRILAWAYAHYQRTGIWPKRGSGPIAEAPDETWEAVDAALYQGVRGLPGGSSLARLLAERRAVPNVADMAPLSVPQILAWADDHYVRTRKWPKAHSGPIALAPDETWSRVNSALKSGSRTLPGGSSLARLLAQHRGVVNIQALPRLTVSLILCWADEHYRRKGTWPRANSGVIPGADGTSWGGVDLALRRGTRRLRGGSSLSLLLRKERPGSEIWGRRKARVLT